MSGDSDLRVVKTHKLIRDAFVKLMDEKGFKNITVNDIANKAMINRSTFYLHYIDKYDLLNKTVAEAIQKIMQLVAPETHIISGKLEYDSFQKNIECILKTIEADALLYKIMLNDKEMLGIERNVENALKNKLSKYIFGKMLIPKDLFLELLTSYYICAIRWWLNNDMKYAPSFMAKELMKFLTIGPCRIAGDIQTNNAAPNKFL